MALLTSVYHRGGEGAENAGHEIEGRAKTKQKTSSNV